MNENRGLTFALLTALVSGTAIFVNKFAVSSFNPFVFTSMKNLIVAVFLLSIILLFKEFNALKALGRKQWAQLSVIGLVGGSVPFLLYFYALKLTSALNAGFLHKTLFLWVSVLAVLFLKEKLSRNFLIGAVLLLAGNFLVLSINSFGFPEALLLLATLLWAAENVISKHVLRELSSKTVAFGRMFFGSMIMLGFLLATNQFSGLFAFSLLQLEWILLVSGFLLLYVLFWYEGLKHLRASIAASILLLGQVVTASLSFVFLDKAVSLSQGVGLFLLVLGVVLIVGVNRILSVLKNPFYSFSRN